MLDLISVRWVIVVVNQSYGCGVVGKSDDSFAGVDGGTVMNEKLEREGAKDASLQCTSFYDESGRGNA